MMSERVAWTTLTVCHPPENRYKSTIAFLIALPQAMAYMMANPHPDRPLYGLITNGDEFMFIKMLTQGLPQYDLSNVFSLLIPSRNQLYDILQILKQIRQIMLQFNRP